MTSEEREAVLRWRARNWTPSPAEDEIDFWEADLSTPNDPILAREKRAAEQALLRVARMERKDES